MNFEAHITVGPFKLVREEHLLKIAADNHWKTSRIDGDPLLGPGVNSYLTRHGTRYDNLLGHMQMTKGDLERAGFNVVRCKIELIMYDTKTGEGV